MTTNNPATGILYFLSGFKLLFSPGIKRFVILPLGINIILVTSFFLLSRHFVLEFNQWLYGYLPHWLQWLSSIIWLAFYISFFLVLTYLLVTLSNIVCLPFNSLLAEKVELKLTNKVIAQKNLRDYLKEMKQLMGRQLALIAYYLPRAFLCMIMFFIPIIQIFAAFFWFGFNAWMMTIQHIDYPMDNNHVSFSELRKRLAEKRWIALGFGGSVVIASMVPVINFFVVPAAVVGATLFWVKEFKDCSIL